MSEYVVKLRWSLADGELALGKYNTNHRMTFSGGLSATMTAASTRPRALSRDGSKPLSSLKLCSNAASLPSTAASFS